MTERDVATVERQISAPPARIFDLLADPSRHQEIDGSGTVREATDGSQRLAMGSKFGMSMRLGIGYSMESTIIEFEENRRIAWQTRPTLAPLRLLVGGRIWRYELTPTDGGTLVRESWDIRQEAMSWMVYPMKDKTIESMTKTLERIATVVEK